MYLTRVMLLILLIRRQGTQEGHEMHTTAITENMLRLPCFVDTLCTNALTCEQRHSQQYWQPMPSSLLISLHC
jgi:hypothetical protein